MNITFPIKHCTKAEYAIVVKENNMFYIISDAEGDDVTVYFNEIAISNMQLQFIEEINERTPDESGALTITASDVGSYTKEEVLALIAAAQS